MYVLFFSSYYVFCVLLYTFCIFCSENVNVDNGIDKIISLVVIRGQDISGIPPIHVLTLGTPHRSGENFIPGCDHYTSWWPRTLTMYHFYAHIPVQTSRNMEKKLQSDLTPPVPNILFKYDDLISMYST